MTELRSQVSDLNRYIGIYPPRIGSEGQREEVYGRWTEALRQAWQIENQLPLDEATLALLADLYRQGHNLDVTGADRKAIEALDKCLARYADSIRCHLAASYFYLSTNPQYAPKGEASLLRLRELMKTQANPEIERGLVFAYLYQQKMDLALKQIDHYLTLAPNDENMRKVREAVARKAIEVKQL
ncbi:hypothetical protein [Pseudoduganella sp.]|uniref:hypothetical protein n=1 Tax=Pseudoduganella sp. TaxID=1880898 RepID=UPI0035B15E2C